MLESFLMKKKAGLDPNALLYIDFTKGTVGSQVVYDQVTKQNLTRSTWGSPSTADGYVNHPTFGLCYYFNGNVNFTLPSIIALDTMHYQFQAEVATTDTTSYMILYESGDYPTAPNAGANFNLNNTTAAYWGLFQTTGGGTYREIQLNGTNDQGMNVLVARKDGTGTTLSNTTKGTSTLFNNYGTNGDTFARIGSNSAQSSAFKGWIRNMSITKLA